jgi:ribonuclease HI
MPPQVTLGHGACPTRRQGGLRQADGNDATWWHGVRAVSYSAPQINAKDAMLHTMLINDHIKIAANDFFSYHARRKSIHSINFDRYQAIGDSDRKFLRRHIYRDTIEAQFDEKWNEGEKSLEARLQHWGFDIDPRCVRSHADHLSKLPSYLIAFQLRLWFKAVDTDRQLSTMQIFPNDPRPASARRTCFLCWGGAVPPKPGDNIPHLYGTECSIAHSARRKFYRKHRIHPGCSFEDNLLLTSPHLKHPSSTQAAVVFNYALWDLRRRVFRQEHQQAPAETAIDRVYDYANTLLTLHKIRIKPPVTGHCHAGEVTKVRNFFERARLGWRPPRIHQAQMTKNNAINDFHEILPSWNQDFVCYTDGGCLGNPGPCGAGISLHFPGGRTELRYGPLGFGTNNIGELYALAAAIKWVGELNDDDQVPLGTTIHFCTDSQYVINLLTGNAICNSNTLLVRSTQDYYAALCDSLHVLLHWTPGHSGIFGNEESDRMANLATSFSFIKERLFNPFQELDSFRTHPYPG